MNDYSLYSSNKIGFLADVKPSNKREQGPHRPPPAPAPRELHRERPTNPWQVRQHYRQVIEGDAR